MKRVRKRGSGLRLVVFLLFNAAAVAVLLEAGVRIVYPIVRLDAFTWAGLREELLDPNRDEAIVTADAVRVPPGAPMPVIHPYLGFVMEPYSEMTTPRGETLRYSGFGFFGDEPVLERRDDEAVAVIAGGSVAVSLWHNEGAAIGAALERLPEFAGKRVRVQSLALGGYKQPQMLQSLTYLLALGAPIDVWIELDGFNDIVLPISENVPAGDPIEFPRDWRVLSAAKPPAEIVAARERVESEKAARERIRRWFAAAPLRYSAFAVAVWDTLDRRHIARLSALVQSLNETVHDRKSSLSDEERRTTIRRSIAIWRNASVQMHRICAANGIAYYHFVQPNQYYEGSKPFSDEERRKAIVAGGYQPAATMGYPMLAEAAGELRAEGIPIHDLTMLFRDEPRTVYRDSCCHLNELGNQLLADAIVKAISNP